MNEKSCKYRWVSLHVSRLSLHGGSRLSLHISVAPESRMSISGSRVSFYGSRVSLHGSRVRLHCSREGEP